MNKLKPNSPYRLANLLRREQHPISAFNLFLNPNPNSNSKPFPYSLLSYDIIITKLGRAKLFDELDTILSKLMQETKFNPTEIIFCNVMKYHARARLPERALKVLDEMPKFRCRRTVKSFNSLLDGLLTCREYDKMERIFLGMSRFTRPDVCTYNIMMNACKMKGDLMGAWKVFDEMCERGLKPNEVTFATLIVGLCQGSRLKEAFELKEEMSRVYKVEPNAYVYASLIKGLCDVKELEAAFRLKDEMVERKVKVNSAVYSTLISGLFKAGREDEVHSVLEEMKNDGCNPDTVTYNALISGFCGEGQLDLALRVLDEMKEKGCKEDVISYNVLIRAYCKEGNFKEAMELFEDMPRRGVKPDVSSYRILLQGLIDEMKLKEAAFVLDEMIFKGYPPYPLAINKLLQDLHEEENLELMSEVLGSLGKGSYVDINSWTLAISTVCKKFTRLSFDDLFDTLTISDHASLNSVP